MGASVGAVLLRREREVVEAFRAAGATSAERATSLDALRLDESVAVRRLRRRAVLREAGGSALWLDEPSWAALRGMRRRVVAVLLVVVAALAAAGVFATHAGTR